MNEKLTGRYIVADPEICHGQPTFRRTRIMVWQILEMIAEGMILDDIVKEWDGRITKEAIAEAVSLANKLPEQGPVAIGRGKRLI